MEKKINWRKLVPCCGKNIGAYCYMEWYEFSAKSSALLKSILCFQFLMSVHHSRHIIIAVTLPLANRLQSKHVDIASAHSHATGYWTTESSEKCCRRWCQKSFFFWRTSLDNKNGYRDHTSANCGSPNSQRRRHYSFPWCALTVKNCICFSLIKRFALVGGTHPP